jgi:phosphodiesterase/alkaline phosphatase D-like protein
MAQDVTQNSATIWWESSAPGPTILKYGTDPNNLNQTAQAPWGQMSHHVPLPNLRPDTTYYFHVENPNGQVMGQGQFHTQAANWSQSQGVQIVNGPVIEQVTPTTAVIAWTTNVPSSAVVHYSTDSKNLAQTAEAPWGGTTHRVTINNLQPNGTYYFQVESGQAQGSGNGTKSPESMFQTPVNDAGNWSATKR